LRRFEDATERIAGGDLGARVGPQTSTELHNLGTSFDAMAARLEHLVEAQRGFAADASHQLRTPLTAMRVRLDQTAELVHTDPEAAVVNIDAVREETDRMQRLVDGLLTLARADGAAVDLVRVDAASVVRERADTWRALAEERGVDVTTSAPDHAWAVALPGGLEQIVDNYVDNALEVAPAGSAIDLEVAVRSDAVEVCVCDRGPGLSEHDRARVFDRFWRGGTARGGSGLGLAIVASLAAASGASVAFDERPGGGTVARIVLRPEARPRNVELDEQAP
jgi:signal transduction histidine kinase